MLKKIVLLTLPWIAFAYSTFSSKFVEIHHIKMIVSNVVISTHFADPGLKNTIIKNIEI